MTFITSTITSANPAADLYTAIAGALSSEGYTLVDTVVISTRTHKVWKCPAANNAAGKDWYLDVTYTTSGAGSVWWIPYEAYDPVTHLAYRGPVATASGSLDAVTYSRNGATGAALESALVGIHAGVNTTALLTTPSSSFGYWISVTPNRLIGNVTATPAFLLYAGLYEPTAEYSAIAGADLFPLVMCRLNPGSTSWASAGSAPSTASGGIIRVPKATVLTGWDSTLAIYSDVGNALWLPQIPAGSQLINNRSVAKLAIGTGTNASPVGQYGYLYDVRACQADATVTRGDTVTLSGDATQWRLASSVSGSAAMYRAA